MKKIKNRSVSVIVLVILLGICLSVFMGRYINDAEMWVAFSGNGNAYSSGMPRNGVLKDRNGIVLMKAEDGKISFAEDKTIREAALHVVGDKEKNIGTGVMSVFASQFIGYDPLNGLYSASGKGGEVTLSIDAMLNKTLYEALDGRNGCGAVVDYTTGEILCMVSAPAFDPENPPELREDDKSGVYINRFVSAAYTPGSVFKLVTLAAAIDNIDDIYGRTFVCEGTKKFEGGSVSCTRAHGNLKIEDALSVSCNCVFGTLAVELGADTIEKYAERFGLLEKVDINGIKSSVGKYEKAADDTVNLAWSGAGQYNNTVNPAAMLRFVCSIANGGYAVDMTLRMDSTGDSKKIMSGETADELASMMNYTAVQTYGKENFPGLELYAKSGTAEVGADKRPHAWFTGFIKNEDHPLAFVIVIENGGWGSTEAGAVANIVLQKAIEE